MLSPNFLSDVVINILLIALIFLRSLIVFSTKYFPLILIGLFRGMMQTISCFLFLNLLFLIFLRSCLLFLNFQDAQLHENELLKLQVHKLFFFLFNTNEAHNLSSICLIFSSN